MEYEIIIALATLLGTVVGSFAGIVINTRLINYRLAQLEQKVDKHNRVIDRVYRLERQKAVADEEFKIINRRLDDLEAFHK